MGLGWDSGSSSTLTAMLSQAGQQWRWSLAPASGRRYLLAGLIYFFSEGLSCLFKDPAEHTLLLKGRVCDLIAL